MAEQTAGIGLADAIAQLRAQFEKAVQTGAGAAVQFPVDQVTVELTVVATREAGGKAGFTVPVIGLELGGSAGWKGEVTHKVTVRMGAPLDRAGRPIKVVQVSDQNKD